MNRRTLELRIRQAILGPVVRRCQPLLFAAAFLWRRLLLRTTFVAITGSVGKTTTKEFLGEILESRGRTFRTLGNQNSGLLVALSVLRVRPWHRFAVIEVGVDRPGVMRRMARMVKPHVVLILAVKRAHTKMFPDTEQYAAEKAILLESLVPGGTAILNGDDPRVAKMGTKPSVKTGASSRGNVRLIGTSPEFDYWFDQVSGQWPERLRFCLHWGGEHCEVETQQVGTHWATAMTATLAAAHTLGVPIPDAARILRQCSPYAARLEPIALPSGAVFIRDDYDGCIDALDVSLRMLREADASRRVLVIGDFSDSGLSHRQRMKLLASQLTGWIGLLVLCGEHPQYGRRKAIASGIPGERIVAFETLKDASDYLRSELRAGDVALLKGRGSDHMARVFFGQIGSVACWRRHCRKTMICDACWELGFQTDAANEYIYPKLPVFR